MTTTDTCVVCRHRPHRVNECGGQGSGPGGRCGCNHGTNREQPKTKDPRKRKPSKTIRETTGNRIATQAWQQKVPDRTTDLYEELNTWFYTTQAAAKGLKGSLIDYMRNLDGTYNGLSWGQALVRKMKLRWGMGLQLRNLTSMQKMIDGFGHDLSGFILEIVRQEIGAPEWRVPTDWTPEQERAREIYDRINSRVWHVISPHYAETWDNDTQSYIAGFRGADELDKKKENASDD